MKRQGQTITEIEFADLPPKRATIVFVFLCILVSIVAGFWLALGSVNLTGTGPRLICFVGEEVVFSRQVDAAIQVGDAITITIGNHTNPITPPEGGKCYIAR